MSNYVNLKNYLLESNQDELLLTFEEIEKIICSELPQSARKHRAYFSNSRSHSYTSYRLDAGYRINGVDYVKEIVKFTKILSGEQQVLISSDYLFNEKELKKVVKSSSKVFTTECALFEFKYFGILNDQEIKSYLNKYNIAIINNDARQIAFEEFLKKYSVILDYYLKSYAHYADVSFLNFLNLYRINDINLRDIAEIFSIASTHAFIPFSKITRGDTDLEKAINEKEILKRYEKNINPKILKTIKEKTNVLPPETKRSFIPVSNTTIIDDNFDRYAFKDLLKNYNKENGFFFFSPFIISEYFAVTILDKKVSLVYYTKSNILSDVSIGSLIHRVAIKQQ